MYEKNYKVPSFLCHNGKLLINYLVNLCLMTSDCEFEEKGHSYQDIIYEKNLTWIIYKWKINFNREIKENETIKIKTWPSGFDKIYSYREFTCYDKDEKLLFKATAVFLLIDIKNKKPIRLSKEIIDLYDIYEKRNFLEIERIDLEEEINKLASFDVRKSDIDYNKHVNNSVYFSWIFDSIPEEFLENKFISDINLIYNKEIKTGERVEVYSNDIYSYFEIKTENTNSKAALKFKYLNN